MQIQKDEVRQKILNAATEEFLNNEYRKASLRNIAKNAEITVSNIYRYFQNKAELYIAVVEPAWQGIQSLILLDKENTNTSPQTLLTLSEEIVKVYMANRSPFEILLMGDSDTPRKDTRETLLKLVMGHIHDGIFASGQFDCDDVVIKALATAVSEAMICILATFDGNEKLLIQRIYTTIYFLLGNKMFLSTTEE